MGFFNVFVRLVVLLSMERLIRETAAYCGQRKAFGKSILDNQYVHFRLAELQTEVELLRSLIYRTTGGCPLSAISTLYFEIKVSWGSKGNSDQGYP